MLAVLTVSLGSLELWVGGINHNENSFFSFILYIAASHIVHAHCFLVYIYSVSCHLCITFLNMLPIKKKRKKF